MSKMLRIQSKRYQRDGHPRCNARFQHVEPEKRNRIFLKIISDAHSHAVRNSTTQHDSTTYQLANWCNCYIMFFRRRASQRRMQKKRIVMFSQSEPEVYLRTEKFPWWKSVVKLTRCVLWRKGSTLRNGIIVRTTGIIFFAQIFVTLCLYEFKKSTTR